MKKVICRETILLVFCLLVGFALRYYTLDRKSLWIDEVHTFNDSKGGLFEHIKDIKEGEAELRHPPLFYALTHLFHPFEKPERDLRIIPLLFGTLSIPMIYFLSRLFSPSIAVPCTLSLSFMTYHISYSQEGRAYALILFLGMVGLYLLMKYIMTLKKRYLIGTAFCYAIAFHTSYSFILFMIFSQGFWFYRIEGTNRKPALSPFLTLNGLALLLCLPWILFVWFVHKSGVESDLLYTHVFGSFFAVFSDLLNDWVPFFPLTLVSVILLFLFPFFAKNKRNALLLLSIFTLPVVSLYAFCNLFNIYHFFSSKYVINFLPLLLVALYLSLQTIEGRFEKLRRIISLKLLFIILFIGSNMMILPLYYRAQKQDFRGLVSYLEGNLRDGDRIFVKSVAYMPGILHYFKVYPKSRYYHFPFRWIDSEKKEFEYEVVLSSADKRITIFFTNIPLQRYLEGGKRLWVVVGTPAVKEMKETYPCRLMGYFDGTYSHFRRFPGDASMYLFLCARSSPGEEDSDIKIE